MSAATLIRPARSRARSTGGPEALVVRAPGTNCDRETALALELAGARPTRIHVEALLAGAADLDRFGVLVLPGGFSFGDHLGAGALWAHRLGAAQESLARFVADGRPVLGICNGFQALLKLGVLPGGTLGANASGRYECRWVRLERPANATTPLLAGIDRISLPVAHGEGRYVAERETALRQVQERGNVALVYVDDDGPTGAYPANPNGSAGAVAALANDAGNVLGLMPHPERAVLPGMAPAGREDGVGLAIFRNAVAMAKG